MKNNLFFLLLAIAILTFISCKKTINEINIYPESSQLWVKVNGNVTDFNISFNCQDIIDKKKDYLISYLGNVFKPNMRTFTDNTNNETWVLIYKSYERTDEISLQLLGNRKVYKAKGFEFGEKRFIEIILNPSGSFNVADRDITTINKVIYLE